MAASRYYSSVAGEMTLQASIGSGDTSLSVDTTSGLPVTFPYTLIVDYGSASEEIVDVTAASGTTLTVTRGVDGTTAQAHTFGAIVRHGVTGRDHRESREHEAATAAHGVAEVVGTTDVQTLDNKTFQPDADHTPLTLRHRATNTTPLLAVQDDGGVKVAEVYSGGFRGWYSTTEQDWNIYAAGAVNLWKRVLEVFLRSDRIAIVGRKIAGATANFISFFDTDGTTELFSVDKDGAVSAASVTTTGAVTAGGAVSGAGVSSSAGVTATGTVQGGTVTSTGAVNAASANVTGAVTAGSVASTGAVTGSNLPATPAASAGKQIAGRTYSITTDASGFATVTHGLGFTPTGATCNRAGTGGALYRVDQIGSFTSTTFQVRALDGTGGPAVSASMDIYVMSWE